MHSRDSIVREPVFKATGHHGPRAATPGGGRGFAAAFGRDGWG